MSITPPRLQPDPNTLDPQSPQYREAMAYFLRTGRHHNSDQQVIEPVIDLDVRGLDPASAEYRAKLAEYRRTGKVTSK